MCLENNMVLSDILNLQIGVTVKNIANTIYMQNKRNSNQKLGKKFVRTKKRPK